MTRERFQIMQMETLEGMKAKIERHRKNPRLEAFVREELEKRYQAISQTQAEWERGGFWTVENEKRYHDLYKRLN